MLFSSSVFLFAYLPVILIVNFALRGITARNDQEFPERVPTAIVVP